MSYWLAALLIAWSSLAAAETWRFGLIGDTPYSDYERHELPGMLEAMADREVDFIAHIGDFKHGSGRCDDAVFEDRRQLFNNARVPFIYIPGDNEWSDCERLSNGSYNPQERLGKLRRLFFEGDQSLGRRTLKLERQGNAYPEHARFRIGPVLFVTFNLPGGNNNHGPADEAGPEFLARNPATLHWLRENFNLARAEKLAGIVLLFQANPGFKYLTKGFPIRGYRDFLEALREETLAFPGQVVAVHGDTHISRIDQPLRDKRGRVIHNFVRVETFGYPLMGWTLGVIDSQSPPLFRFEMHAWPEKNP